MPHPAFTVHMLNEIGRTKAGAIAKVFDDAVTALFELCPGGGREWSLVLTKLEEACFFAKKAMANDTANSSGEILPGVTPPPPLPAPIASFTVPTDAPVTADAFGNPL